MRELLDAGLSDKQVQEMLAAEGVPLDAIEKLIQEARALPKEEKAAQRAADANVDASLQQYMAQREAKKAAAGGGRKPVSDRLKKLRERAG